MFYRYLKNVLSRQDNSQIILRYLEDVLRRLVFLFHWSLRQCKNRFSGWLLIWFIILQNKVMSSVNNSSKCKSSNYSQKHFLWKSSKTYWMKSMMEFLLIKVAVCWLAALLKKSLHHWSFHGKYQMSQYICFLLVHLEVQCSVAKSWILNLTTYIKLTI